MPPLDSKLRGLLEKKIVEARDEAEDAARATLRTLAVASTEAFGGMSAEQKRLRNGLRAKARQLGNGSFEAGRDLLMEELAYQQWHRMLFARFLAENGLLMHPEGMSVTLEECGEIAAEEGQGEDAWTLAARYAGAMLPGIFRRDEPAAQVRFAPEGRHKLENILGSLPPVVFTADDALGWVYQFWQTKKKKEVNESGKKIGGASISPVTQLFTEDYMVRFLLENSLGAWWAARHPESPLLKSFTYLRFRDPASESSVLSPQSTEPAQSSIVNPSPAAGKFEGWPTHAAEITVLDPCCGSGHFLVAAFEMLRRMRMEEEGLGEAEAAEAVLRDNLYGLELDPRCTQIAAFALALAAWKAGGYRPLPLPNIACSGLPVSGQWADWKKLAGGDGGLELTLLRLYELFKNAPDLGSLINPADVLMRDRMFSADYSQVERLLEKALAQESEQADPAAAIFGTAVQGIARAANLLSGAYTLIATNVPYLARGKQGEILQKHCEGHYPDAKTDLATTFVERCRTFAAPGGSYALVTPQNWLFLGSYKDMREKLLLNQSWECVIKLGENGFESSAAAGAFTALFILTNRHAITDQLMSGIDAAAPKSAAEKAALMRISPLQLVKQAAQLKNSQAVITLDEAETETRLEKYAVSLQGISPADFPHYGRMFWEITPGKQWEFWQSSPDGTTLYGGRSKVLWWNKDLKEAVEDGIAYIRGQAGWGKVGVAVGQMRQLPCTLYTGEKGDTNVAIIVPNDPTHLPAIWAFCKSPEFNVAVRRIDQKLNVTNATLVKVPFDLERWQKVAEEAGPLPEPYSNDPTQWLFEGNPVGSSAPLQVAVARLLGYRWPQQKLDKLDGLADADGIVCLPPMAHEAAAVERLRALTAAAYGAEWSAQVQEQLLAGVNYSGPGKGLEGWLRDGFFEQHCSLFQNRPFIWHIWDGRKDGFAALVNYHRLDNATLNKLIYTYLGDWINRQRTDRDAAIAGAEGRLAAALELQKKLEAIRDGEPPYDIYVRWKKLPDQPLGWQPDLNDGVRLNIRPFIMAGVLRSKFTLNWNKDRGTNPDGSERLNDLHYTLAEKQKARREAGIE